MELASLYLWLDRSPDANGNEPSVPSGRVLKDRLSDTVFDPETGELQIVQLMPPTIPRATYRDICNYISTPPDYANLAECEKARSQVIAPEEILAMELAKAEAERDMEVAKLEREKRLAVAMQSQPQPQPTQSHDILPQFDKSYILEQMQVIGISFAEMKAIITQVGGPSATLDTMTIDQRNAVLDAMRRKEDAQAENFTCA
jgi:hypothetical protein